jgi:hypothetical protein
LSELAPEHVAKAKRIVCTEFPEMTGTEPTVSGKGARGKGGAGDEAVFVLTFQKHISLPGGGRMARVVRATMGREGEVIKLTSSK